jgi:regulator of PEP synthase PpsR (kinase-PPPase family)
LVPGSEPPPQLFQLKRAVVVGLTLSPDRLIEIRRNRLSNLREDRESTYVDIEAVRAEIVRARRMFEKHGWPVIDVTRRSVEETAAAVINVMTAGGGQVEVLS